MTVGLLLLATHTLWRRWCTPPPHCKMCSVGSSGRCRCIAACCTEPTAQQLAAPSCRPSPPSLGHTLPNPTPPPLAGCGRSPPTHPPLWPPGARSSGCAGHVAEHVPAPGGPHGRVLQGRAGLGTGQGRAGHRCRAITGHVAWYRTACNACGIGPCFKVGYGVVQCGGARCHILNSTTQLHACMHPIPVPNPVLSASSTPCP